jgi:hypothetical protein
MAANIAIEVWQTQGDDLFTRVLYSGQPVSAPRTMKLIRLC